MKLHLYIVVTPALEQTVHQVQARLRQALPDLSFSPAAEQQSLENCLESHLKKTIELSACTHN